MRARFPILAFAFLLIPPPTAAQSPGDPLRVQRQVRPDPTALFRQRFYPDVRNRVLREAIDTLRQAGYRRVRVARQQIDDMTAGVVLWQYPIPRPIPTATAMPIPIPETTEIVLIAAEPLRRSTVSSPPPDTILISRADTVLVIRTDTVYIDRVHVDTVTVYQPGDGKAGLLVSLIGGLGLGGLAGYGISRLRPRAGPPRQPARAEEKPADAPALRNSELEAVMIDEIITVTRGRAVPHPVDTGRSEAVPV